MKCAPFEFDFFFHSQIAKFLFIFSTIDLVDLIYHVYRQAHNHLPYQECEIVNIRFD